MDTLIYDPATTFTLTPEMLECGRDIMGAMREAQEHALLIADLTRTGNDINAEYACPPAAPGGSPVATCSPVTLPDWTTGRLSAHDQARVARATGLIAAACDRVAAQAGRFASDALLALHLHQLTRTEWFGSVMFTFERAPVIEADGHALRLARSFAVQGDGSGDAVSVGALDDVLVARLLWLARSGWFAEAPAAPWWRCETVALNPRNGRTLGKTVRVAAPDRSAAKQLALRALAAALMTHPTNGICDDDGPCQLSCGDPTASSRPGPCGAA